MLSKRIRMAIVALMAFTILASGFAFAQEESKVEQSHVIKLSLADALKMAEESNPQIALSKLAVEKAQLAQQEIKYQDKKTQDIAKNEFEIKYQIEMGKKNAEFGLKMAQLGVDATLRNIQFGVEAAYYGALAADDNLKICEQALERQQEMQKIAEAKLKAGVIAKRDLMDAQVQVASAQAAVAVAESERQKAYINLKKLLNIDSAKEIQLIDKFDFKPMGNLPDVQKLVEEALQKRMDIIEAQGKLDIAQLDFDMTSSVYPSNTFKYKEKEYALQDAKMNLENKKKDVDAEVRGVLLDLAEAQSNIPVLEKSVDTARESLRLAKLSYEAGTAVRVDVSQAVEMLRRVELQMNQAIYNYNLAKIKLENVIYIPVTSNASSYGSTQ